MMKIIGLGLFKTGTTSLGRALEILQYQTSYEYWGVLGEDWDLSVIDHAKHHETIKKDAMRWEAMTNAPWLYMYRELDKWFAQSKFILTLRADPEAVAMSDIAMWKRMGEKQIPPMEKFIQRYNQHNARVRSYFANRPNDLLEMCFEDGDGWEKLCHFLGKSPPQEGFPHSNKQSIGPARAAS